MFTITIMVPLTLLAFGPIGNTIGGAILAAFGVFMKTKDKDMKGVSLSAGITGLFGITEPAIYGVNLRLKKPMICGELGADLELTEAFVRMGVDELSVAPAMVLKVRKVIRELDTSLDR